MYSIDPCDSKPCGPNAECSVSNHAPQCHCPKYGFFTGDPYELSKGCIQGNSNYAIFYVSTKSYLIKPFIKFSLIYFQLSFCS